MHKLTKCLRHITAGLTVFLVVGCGTTATKESHPSLANSSDSDAAKVYFLRTNPGFNGVVGNAFKISLAGQELLTIAKGEYILVHLKNYSGDVVVESTQVIDQRRMNTQVTVEESGSFTFDESRTYYIAFRESYTGYIPYEVSEGAARDLAASLKPVGAAIAAPL